jgi:transposase
MTDIESISGIHALRADYYPLLGQLMNEIGMAEIINKLAQPEGTQAKIDVGTYVALFIHHILGDVNIKMYRMEEFFLDKAIPLLIPWNPHVDLADLNDDRAARVLDSIWQANPQRVFSAVISSVISKHGISNDVIHTDTTSKSFYGAYNGNSDDWDAPQVVHGFSKDHRPDLKQLLFGVGTSGDGIPIIAEVTNGNESDMALNGRWVKNLRNLMKKEQDEFLLYIADSSLVTTENLKIRQKENIDIISRLPARFGIENELKNKAMITNNWEHIGKISEEKGAASYKAWNTIDKIEETSYRFIVVHSDHLDKRKLKRIEKSIAKEFDLQSKLMESLSKRRFACEEDAWIEVSKHKTSYPATYHDSIWEVEQRIEKCRRKKRGRPKKDEVPDHQIGFYVNAKLAVKKEIVRAESEIAGMFVLITSLTDVKKYPAEYVLKLYKGQYDVERIFRFIKNPAWVGAFCLKKNERLATLGYILLIAAVIYTLWERRVRMALAKADEKPIEGLNRVKTKKPTSYALQTIMSGILVLYRIRKEEMIIWLSKPLKNNQKRVLELSGFSSKIYEFGGILEKMENQS